MDNLKQLKIKNDYKKVEERIGSLDNYQSLRTLSDNIKLRIKNDADYKDFIRLADNAEHKAKVVRILERCPSPINDSKLERTAFENFVEGCAVLNRMPNVRVIHHQLNKLGYAKTMAKQVENEVGNRVFFEMVDKGRVRNTSEYFIYNSAKHLVSKDTYNKIADLFNSNTQLGMVA